MDIGSAPPWFRKRSPQLSCSSAGPIAARNVARAAECPPGVHAKEEWKSEKHSAGSKGRCETVSPESFLSSHDESRPPPERQLASSSYCPIAQTLAPAKHEGVSVAVLVRYHQFHPETGNLGLPAQAGHSSV